MAHNVYCVKLKRELPGLDEPPFDNDLGRKVYDNVSQEAWRMWTEHCKMLLNEYRLNPARREDQEVIVKQMEQFFFGEGSALPKEYVLACSEIKLRYRLSAFTFLKYPVNRAVAVIWEGYSASYLCTDFDAQFITP